MDERLKAFANEWYSSINVVKELYRNNIIYEIGPNDLPGIQPHRLADTIVEAIRNPIACKPLNKLAKTGMKVAIVVDDMTRPTPRDKILPVIINELNGAGVSNNDITVVIALGTHRYMNREEILRYIGKEVVERVRVVNHEWMDPDKLVMIGRTESGIPVYVNRIVYESDLVIGIGSIAPHPVASYGGGAKIILPGVCGRRTVEHIHVLGALLDPMNLLGNPDNAIRRDMEEVAEIVGLRFIVNVVVNTRGEVVKVVAGDPRKAFREGVGVAKEIFEREIPKPADIAIVNSYPAVLDYWQAGKAFIYAQLGVREGGTVILYTDCPEGISPIHGRIFEKYSSVAIRKLEEIIRGGGEEDLVGLAVAYIHYKYINRTECICISRGLTLKDKGILKFKHANSIAEAVEMAIEKHGDNAEIGIVHYGGEVIPVPKRTEKNVHSISTSLSS